VVDWLDWDWYSLSSDFSECPPHSIISIPCVCRCQKRQAVLSLKTHPRTELTVEFRTPIIPDFVALQSIANTIIVKAKLRKLQHIIAQKSYQPFWMWLRLHLGHPFDEKWLQEDQRFLVTLKTLLQKVAKAKWCKGADISSCPFRTVAFAFPVL
jgi:hypothetical protein